MTMQSKSSLNLMYIILGVILGMSVLLNISFLIALVRMCIKNCKHKHKPKDEYRASTIECKLYSILHISA